MINELTPAEKSAVRNLIGSNLSSLEIFTRSSGVETKKLSEFWLNILNKI